MVKKNITFRIDDSLIEKLNKLRGKTSQNAFLEGILTDWSGGMSASTSTSNDYNLQVIVQAQAEMLKNIQAQVQLLVNQQVQVQVQATPATPLVLNKEEVIPTVEPEEDDDQSMGGMFHIIPKTHKVGKPHKQMKQYHEGPVGWMILEGCRSHFDKNDNMIPFRFTDENGKVWEPDLDEINELSQYYGKPVEMEQ